MSTIPETMKAIQIQEQGGPEVMEIREIPTPHPDLSQVLFKRGGIYKVALPYSMGHEASGRIVSVGKDVTDYKVGDKIVAYTAEGGFADYCLATESQLAKLPEGMSTRDGAAIFLQGLTVVTLIKDAHEAKKGQYILVHAAAGGVGLLLCQTLSSLGVHVIGTTSTQEKADLAKANGAEHVLLYSKDTLDEVVKKIKALTPDGAGVHAVLDGVGADTWESDFEVARRKATLVSFGNASGPVPPFAPLKLGPKNLKVCRPVLNNYVITKEEMQYYSNELFDLYKKDAFKLEIWKDGYPFSAEGIRQAHEDLAGRRTTGKLIMNMQ
ncbi:MAG: NADPH:quinone reductase [Cyphobasidiales sp. Tagirdzhanova-0007]|nr:MAG: NADPH:quinone reductase [Cyphobasidiales sp. Tagirdzhanova-0007]